MIEIWGGDPALINTGICLPNGHTQSIITGPAKLGDKRLTILRNTLVYWVRAHPCRFAVLEDIPYSSKGNTAGAAMGHSIFRQVMDEYEVPIGLVVPSTLKLFATGKGNADKAEMVAAANRHGWTGTDHNQADAWWLWQMGRFLAGTFGLDATVDEFLHPDVIRKQCVFGPWRKSPGAKWPDRLRVAATRS